MSEYKCKHTLGVNIASSECRNLMSKNKEIKRDIICSLFDGHSDLLRMNFPAWQARKTLALLFPTPSCRDEEEDILQRGRHTATTSGTTIRSKVLLDKNLGSFFVGMHSIAVRAPKLLLCGNSSFDNTLVGHHERRIGTCYLASALEKSL
jgi:hypothetical protein